jgi:hypothetical protein
MRQAPQIRITHFATFDGVSPLNPKSCMVLTLVKTALAGMGKTHILPSAWRLPSTDGRLPAQWTEVQPAALHCYWLSPAAFGSQDSWFSQVGRAWLGSQSTAAVRAWSA